MFTISTGYVQITGRKICKFLLMLSIPACIIVTFATESTARNPVGRDGKQGESFIAIINFYDNCKLCCGKDESHPAYGITASGERTRQGYAACNWMPFGTKIEVEGLGVYVIKDRGAKSLFGTPKNPIKRIDIWVPTHAEARKLGKQTRRVVMMGQA